MHYVRSTLPILLTATLAALAGCRVPISEQPLTTEMPSPIDERLIGTWEVDMSPVGDGGGEKQIATYIVRRHKDDPRRLEVVGLQDGVEQTAEATTLVTCHYAMHDYLSLGPMNKEAASGYAVCTYRLDDADHGNVYLMDADYMIDAIDRGLVAGEVSRDGPRVTGIGIRATPDELRRFIARHSPDCFAMKTPLAARRVK
jgi:hypothetical protein